MPRRFGGVGQRPGGVHALASNNEKHPGDQGQHHENEALILKGEVEEVDEGVKEEPEAKQAKAKTADRRICHE